ncbi:MAG: alpha-2-macroglobulin family protein [Verrucomicrobiota bacterium]
MKKLALAIGLAVTFITQSALAGPRDAQWKKVQEAVNKGLPKTAIENLQPIIDGALADKAYAEAVKAIGQKIALEGNIEGNKPEEKIFRLQNEIAKYPVEMRPTLEAVLAHWYWHYFQHNRWRFLKRTQTAAAPGKDIQTWDLPRILAEIDQHFTAALADDKTLKATPVSAYDDLLVKGALPDKYRPTMFDFIAHEALQFYVIGEQGAAQAEDAFSLSAESQIFGTATEFMAWQPDTGDETSPTLKAIRLYQQLLRFHQNDEDKTAFADVDLARLIFGWNKATGETKNDRYKTALKRYAADWADHELSARAIAEWAGVLNQEGEPVEAHKLAERGLKTFPNSVGAAQCFNLIQQIEAKSANIQTERVWNEPLPSLNVTYRNVTKVYFRAVAYNFESYLTSQRWGLYNLDDKQRKQILAKAPALEWNADLPATTDYRERVEKLPAPQELKPGFYFIVASHDPSFGEQDNQVSVAPVWVSDFALVMRQRRYDDVAEAFVLKAQSGEPVANVRVQIWARDREGWFRAAEQKDTDENGLVRFAKVAGRQCLFVATLGRQQLATAQESYFDHNNAENSGSQTVFFTDRSLYRPGQTIFYKGIHLRYNQISGEYQTAIREDVQVTFYDPNNKEIARATHRCNDYGSFDGAFTAPRDRVMGRMRIEGPSGTTFFNVEEYKRPKFQVELAPPKEAAKLNTEVTVTGKATAYTGATIGGAKVKWRVVREVRFPVWCWWSDFIFFGRQSSQAIAHGSAVTAADGSFPVTFTARPDLSVPEKNEPVFEYQVYADVTDTTGETRSDQQTVRASYTALQASLSAAEWQTPGKPVELTIETKTLDGEPQAASVNVKIYRLKQPAKVIRANLQPDHGYWLRWTGATPVPLTEDPNSWELAGVVGEKSFKTDEKGVAKVALPVKAGIYRAVLETKDRFGKPVTARLPVQVVDAKAKKYPVKVPNLFTAEKWSLEPGESLLAVWGTGYDKGRAFVEVEHRGKLLKSFWTAAEATQEVIEQAVNEEMRGGFTLRVTYVRENRAYLNERIVDVPWSNKQLNIKWEHFTSKLAPGQKETWTAVITKPDVAALLRSADGKDSALHRSAATPSKEERAVAEMVAGLYDASLDQYLPHDWMKGFSVFRREVDRVNASFENSVLSFQHVFGWWPTPLRGVALSYRQFPPDLAANLWGYGYFGEEGERMAKTGHGVMRAAMADGVEGMVAAATAAPMAAQEVSLQREDKAKNALGIPAPALDLSKVTARKNLNETAFFFPHLLSDSNGVVRMEFTMPEALTEWKFLGFAHDKQLRAGFFTGKTVTAKDLMVEPNPPRFVREGDMIEFTVKVSNQSTERQTGKVKLLMSDARTLREVNAELGLRNAEFSFDIPTKESKSFSWRLTIPDGCEFLTYKAVGSTGTLSDGEEGFLPVLSRRILVTESLPLPIRGKQTKEFAFTKLIESGKSDTLRHQVLTVQMVSQPAWYAVMALPYLMEYPYECSEQLFNRLYANTLARHIANSDPKIRRIFDQWKGTPALDSPLEKNQDLKSVMLEETPWYRQAMDEKQARHNVGILFDGNRLNEEMARTLRKLSEQQLGEGLWPWFPGGRPSEYISLYIMTGFGRLRHLGTDIDVTPALKSLNALDGWMTENYRHIKNRDEYVLSSLDAIYLYGRSFFLKDQPVEHKEAIEFYLQQARKFWLKVANRQSQAHLAIALQRFGDKETPQAIMQSIKERSVSNEELGMFWRETELSWWWYRAPIETQAMMIEAFAEVMNDAQAVEDCKVWLLKQKQTQDWKTTKATADAIYGLLLRGVGMLASDALVEVSLAGEPIKPEKVEAGTGFYEERFARGEIKPAMGNITVKKVDDGVSWGSVHWQYLEDMTKVTPYEGTPLKLKKTLWVKETGKTGQMLKPVKGALGVGDELVVRVELRTDRDMEYVHLKDQRGSGTEPVNVLSRYKYQDGLAYYESTRDTASHFFIEYLPKGVYVFEYSTRVQLKGNYQTGIAEIQCMYAPEFNSHSESFTLEVK